MANQHKEHLLVTTSEYEDSQDHSLHSDLDPNYTMSSKSQPIPVNTNRAQVQADALASIQSKSQTAPFKPPPLLRSDSMSSRVMEFVGSKFAAGSIKGSIFTMCISIVGAGCLSLPYAIRNVGLILGIFLVFFCAFLAYFTLDLLLISAEYLPETLRGPKPYRNISYQSLAKHSYGNWLSRFLQGFMAVQYFGSMIAYVVAFSGFIDLVYSIYDHPKHWPDSIYIITVIGMCYGVILPLSLFRSLNKLRFSSLMGFAMAIYLVIVVVIEYFVLCSDGQAVTKHYDTTCIWNDNYNIPNNVLWPLTDFTKFYQGFLTAWPLVVFSYTGHPFLLPLYVELARPSIRRMRKVFKRGLFIINILYVLISIFGFLLFLDKVCSNLLLNDFRKHFDVVIAALGIALSCILTEPIFSYNFRRMIGMLFWDKTTQEISTFWHVTITVIFVSMNVALGVAVKSIAVVFGFLGSTTYPTLGYLLPAAFFVKITPTGMYKTRKIIAVIQAVCVALISLCSLAYKFTSPGDESCDNAQTIG
eukprot:482534_1